MTRKQIVLVVALVVATSSLNALVSYRRALRRSTFHSRASSAPGGGEKGPCVDFREAKARAGETTCVSGRGGRVFTSRGGNTFLDFCPDCRTCSSATVIFSSDRSKFGNLQALGGRQVEIEGSIRSYQGRVEIVIRDPQQVRVLSSR